MMRPTAPKVFLFSKENAPRRNPAAFLGFTFLVLPQVKMRLGFTSDCEFTCDAANRSGTPNIFQGKRASHRRRGFLGVTAIANFHSCPSQEEGQMLTKEHCK